VKVVQVRLGHESAKTTLDISSHLFPDQEDRTRAAVDAVLAASCGVSVGFQRVGDQKAQQLQGI